MSLGNFDDIYEILLGMSEEEEIIMKEEPAGEKFVPRHDRIPVGYRWWEEAAREIEWEKENEKVGLFV